MGDRFKPESVIGMGQNMQAQQESIECREIGRSSPTTARMQEVKLRMEQLPRSINDNALLFHKKAVGDDGPCTFGAQEFGEC